jgi:hypothetical protein
MSRAGRRRGLGGNARRSVGWGTTGFAVLRCGNAGTENMRLRSTPMMALKERIVRNGMSQAQAAKPFAVMQGSPGQGWRRGASARPDARVGVHGREPVPEHRQQVPGYPVRCAPALHARPKRGGVDGVARGPLPGEGPIEFVVGDIQAPLRHIARRVQQPLRRCTDSKRCWRVVMMPRRRTQTPSAGGRHPVCGAVPARVPGGWLRNKMDQGAEFRSIIETKLSY